MNTLVIEKQTGGYFKFTLNGDTANAITSIQNDLLAVGTQLHFKTGNGANIIKEQFIYPADVTIIASGTFTFTTVAQVWDKLIDIDYFAWLGGGGTGGVDRFDDLLDTFSYTGNAGKAVVVDGSELRLVPITLYNKRLFTELEDTPSSLVPNKMLVVNPAGTAVVLQDQPEQPEQLLNSVGYFDYNDLITQTTPLNAVANVALKLTNDTEGANTSTDQNPYGVSYVWDYTTNQFNFNELEVGDTIDVRVHVQVTTTSANQRVLLSAKFGIGSIAEFTNIIYENQFKSAGLHEINFVAPFYMGSTYITDNPAELYLTSDASATVKVDGWYVRILRKNINIITVDYTVPDATTTVKGIVRLAGDLAGTANSPTVPELANKVPTSRTVSTTSPLLGGGALSSNLTLSIQQANSVDSGYLTYADWGRFDEAHRDRIVSAAVTGTTTKTLTLTQHDAGTITTSWTDDNTDAVSSVFGRTGAVVAVSGDYTTSLVTESTNKNYQTDNQKLYNDATSSIQTQLNSKANDNAVVKLTGDQTISGVKTFSNPTIFNSSLNIASGAYSILYNPANSAYWQTYVDSSNVFNFGYNGNIVKASISNSGNFTANSFIKSGGTSSQFLKADGSVDSSTYALTSQLHDAVTLGTTGVLNGLSLSGQVLSLALASPTTRGALTSEDYNYFFDKVQGNGNQNYIPKYIFSGSNKVIGNSQIYDNGTNVGIGTTSPSEKLSVVGGNISLGAGYKLQYSSTAYMTPENNVSGAEIATGGILTIKTGGTTERVRVDSSGNVGIGTTSPNSKIQVLGVSGDPTLTAGTAAIATFTPNGVGTELVMGSSASSPFTFWMQNRHTGINGLSYPIALNPLGGNVGIGTTSPNSNSNRTTLTLNNNTWGGQLDINVGGTNHAQFGTDNFNSGLSCRIQSQDGIVFNAGGASEKMRITSGGNVGIGTTSPTSKLHVVGDVYSSGYFNSNNIYLGKGSDLFTGGSANDGGLMVSGSNNLIFGNALTERMRITSGGNVGIGVVPSNWDSAWKALQVSDASFIGNADELLISHNLYKVGEDTKYISSSRYGSLYSQNSGAHWFATAPIGTAGANATLTTRMILTNDGNVGIGTTSPDQKLTVEGNIRVGGVGNGFLLDTLGVNYTNGMKVVNNYETVMFSGRGSSGYVIAGDNNLRFGFGTNYSAGESMRITSGGNVGIGTTSPDGTLTVAKSSPSSYVISSIRNLNSGVGGGAQGTQLNFYGDVGYSINTPTSFIQSTSNDGGSSGQGSLRFGNHNGTASVEQMRITSGGNVLIGTTTDSGDKLHVNGPIRLTGTDTILKLHNTNGTPQNWWIGQDTSGTGNGIFYIYNSTSGVQSLNINKSNNATFAGTVTATGFFNSSDNRLKDLTDYDYNVSDIKPITYLWKDGRDNKKHVGYSAQEVQKVMPDAVNEGTDGMLSVNYVEILVAKISQMEKEIAYLKSKI